MRELLITCGSTAQSTATITGSYIPAVRQGGWSGGIRVHCSRDEPVDVGAYAGLLLSGGGDVHPRFWDEDEAVHPAAKPDEPRDIMEHRMARQAWEAGLPVLGICRGIQSLNVALGGSLIQDIPTHYGCAPERHRCGTAGKPVFSHRVNVESGSRLGDALGSGDVSVNSRHHQAVGRVAPQLRPVAWDPGTGDADALLIEGLEAEDPQHWVLAVQWHPENLVNRKDEAGDAARGLFAAFARALGSAE
jgi:putative glutamine amidotransferase